MTLQLATLAAFASHVCAIVIPALAPRQDATITTAPSATPSLSPNVVNAKVGMVLTGTEWTCSITEQPLSTFTNSVLLSIVGTSTVWSYQSMTFTPTLYCDCSKPAEATASVASQGMVAGLTWSVDHSGTTTTWCATTTQYSSQPPIEVSTPTGTPGDANNEAWAQVSCDYKSLKSAGNNPMKQWADAGANAAYDDAIQAWEQDDKGFDKLTNFIADYFHAPPVPDCDVMDGGRCGDTFNCGQGSNPGAIVNSPAGYMIMNGISGLRDAFESIYKGIDDAFPDVLGEVGKFTSTFSPIMNDIKEQQQLKLIMDFVQLGLVFVMAPSFHNILTRTKFVQDNPNVFGTGVDVAYGALGVTMGAIKDGMEQLSPLTIQNELSAMVGDIQQQWKQGIQTSVTTIMGNDESLLSLINNGQFFAEERSLYPIDIEKNLEKILLASLLPAAWTSGSEPSWPAIITTDGLDASDSCDGWNVDSFSPTSNIGSWISYSIDGTDRVCVDGSSEAYFLIGAENIDNDSCVEGVCQNGVRSDLLPLKGTDTFDGKQWAGLTLDEVVLNAVNTWKDAGNSNAFNPLESGDFEDEGLLDALANGEYTKTRGLVRIPVCSITDVILTLNDDNANSVDKNANYPCPI